MEEEVSLDIKDLWGIIRKRLTMIIIITFFASLVSGLVSFYVIKPTYEAQLSIVIGKTGNNSMDKNQYNYNDVMMYQKLVKTYSVLAKSKTVAQKANEKLDNEVPVEVIQKSITVTPQADTQILQLKSKSNNPREAMDIINAVNEAFEEEARRIFPNGEIKIMDKVEMPTKPVKPNKKLNIVIAFFVGLMVSIGLAFLLEYVDRTIKSENDVEKYLGLPILGVIPKI